MSGHRDDESKGRANLTAAPGHARRASHGRVHSHAPHDHTHASHAHHDHAHHDHARRTDAPTHPPHGEGSSAARRAHRHDGHSHSDAGHSHGGHSHDLRGLPESRLRLALGLTLAYMLVELVVGLYSHSIALASDAGHMFADAGALLLAVIAQRFASRPATPRRTYGFRRAEILAAFVNGVALVATAFFVTEAAWDRWHHPAQVRGDVVTVVGAIGLGVNLFTAWVLSRGHGHNLNTRAALAHVATDAVGSVIAVAAGLVAWRFGWMRADPALSFVMALLIVYGAWSILRRAVVILMEGTPAGLDLQELEATIRATPGVAGMHDLHAWTISEGFDAITVHVVLDGSGHGTDVARAVGERIHAIHRVAHVTVQPEAPPLGGELRPLRSLLHRPNSAV